MWLSKNKGFPFALDFGAYRKHLRKLGLLLFAQDIKPHGGNDDKSFDHQLIERRYAQQAHSVIENTDNKGSDHGSGDGSNPPGKTGTADDNRRDRIEFEHCSQIWGGAV